MPLIYENHDFPDGIPIIYHDDLRFWGGNFREYSNWHENPEILLVTKGEGYFERDTERLHLSVGDMFVITADVLHAIWTESSVKYGCMIIDSAFCEKNGFPCDFVSFPEIINGDPALTESYLAVREEYKSDAPYKMARVRSALLLFLVRLYTGYAREGTAGGRESTIAGVIRDTVKYVHTHYEQRLSLDGIARKMGVSRYYLCREFRRYTGQTLFQYINTVRCKSAREMIAAGSTVSEAAMSSGFDNMSYFTRTYRRCFGILPRDELLAGKSRMTDPGPTSRGGKT